MPMPNQRSLRNLVLRLPAPAKGRGRLQIAVRSKDYRSKCGSVFDTHFLKDMIKVISHRSF